MMGKFRHQKIISMMMRMTRWQALVGTVSHKSCVWLTSRLPLYLWFQVLSSEFFLVQNFLTPFDEVTDMDKLEKLGSCF